VDDDPLKQGAVINGLKVLGPSEALPTLVAALGIDQVIVTIADAPQASLRRILSICEGIPVRAQTIPAMYDLLQGRVSITELREVRVEDLLERETVSLEEHDLVGFLGGKVVMVTGAGGSIGSELARQVARFSPSAASAGGAVGAGSVHGGPRAVRGEGPKCRSYRYRERIVSGQGNNVKMTTTYLVDCLTMSLYPWPQGWKQRSGRSTTQQPHASFVRS
jgi:hypothetical protein